MGAAHGGWWSGLAFTLTGVLGVTFMDAGRASGECVLNHRFAEPFHTTQGLWNLAMTVPVGFLALMAVRRPLPALVGVVVLPLGIEFTQATVDGLGRVCDSSDAEMNILGGLVGWTVAAIVLTARRTVVWRAGLKGALIASLAFLVLGTGVARPMLAYTNVDGTGLSAADPEQKRAMEAAVRKAFGDRYTMGRVYAQPCTGAPCTNIVSILLSRGKDHPQEFGNGTLSWPDKRHLNVVLEDGDRLTVMGYPVAGAKAPTRAQDAYRVAESYARQRYPWVADADVRRTSPVGEKARQGWVTRWRWTHNGVLMPRMLDVQVDRAGRIAQIDVTLGPSRVDLARARIGARQAEEAVREEVTARLRRNGNADAAFEVKALKLKAVSQDGVWTPQWLVQVTDDVRPAPDDTAQEPYSGDRYRVNALSGEVFDYDTAD
nr:VanZ family protein [Streptomyces mexicanus]